VSGTEPVTCGGADELNNGNGSLMRILPLIFHIQSIYGTDFQDEDEAFEIIHQVSSLTHAHNRSKMACGIYLSVASMLSGNMDLEIAVDMGIYKAVEYYKKKHGFKTELNYYSRLSEKGFGELCESEVKSTGYVVDTLEAAIWCLINTKSYKECVLLAINLGEDTDTVAAVAGGLAGLYYGCENIPQDWIAQISRRDYIEKLSNNLYLTLMKGSIDKLTLFIPYFENASKEDVCSWSGGEKLADKHYSMPYPVYDQTLKDFIQAVYKSNLLCHNYLEIIEQNCPYGAKGMNESIEHADLELTLAILTGYIRQERFCDGLWQSAVEDKTFLNLLKRLKYTVQRRY